MISGLHLYTDFLTSGEEDSLLDYIDQQEWVTSLKRRVQHYGYRYDNVASRSGFAKKNAKEAAPITDELAGLRDSIANFLSENRELNENFNQCIVNEYTRNQGIGGHVDHLSFGPTVVSVSLGADCEFVFEHVETGEKRSVWVPRRSLLILTEESRYSWKHSVPNRVGMFRAGAKVIRSADWRRVSATFRSV